MITTDEQYVAPVLFEWEVRNVLLAKTRSGALRPAQLDSALEQLEAFAVDVVEPESPTALTSFARAQLLSLFDASYLALAMRLGTALASRDGDLLSAAVRCGVPIHDLRADA